jgi:hypothetical protein
MLEEYAENLTTVARRARPPTDTDKAGAEENLICSILHKELKKVQAAKAAEAAETGNKGNGASGAAATPSRSSAAGNGSAGTVSAAGIAANKTEWTVEQYAAKVDQLERAIKALLRRNMQVNCRLHTYHRCLYSNPLLWDCGGTCGVS